MQFAIKKMAAIVATQVYAKQLAVKHLCYNYLSMLTDYSRLGRSNNTQQASNAIPPPLICNTKLLGC